MTVPSASTASTPITRSPVVLHLMTWLPPALVERLPPIAHARRPDRGKARHEHQPVPEFSAVQSLPQPSSSRDRINLMTDFIRSKLRAISPAVRQLIPDRSCRPVAQSAVCARDTAPEFGTPARYTRDAQPMDELYGTHPVFEVFAPMCSPSRKPADPTMALLLAQRRALDVRQMPDSCPRQR